VGSFGLNLKGPEIRLDSGVCGSKNKKKKKKKKEKGKKERGGKRVSSSFISAAASKHNLLGSGYQLMFALHSGFSAG